MHVLLLDTHYEIRSFPFASESPAFLLPVVHRSLLERTAAWLSRFGLHDITLVTSRDPAEDFDLSRAIVDHGMKVAPTVQDAMQRAKRRGTIDQPLLMLQPNLHPLPDLSGICATHFRGKQAVTLVKGTCRFGAGQYGWGPPVLVLGDPVLARLLAREHTVRPLADGPRLARSRGLAIEAVDLRDPVVEINNAYALFQANLETLAPGANPADLRGVRQLGPKLWAAPDARIEDVHVDPDGGPVVVGSFAVVVEGTTLRGPTIIGEGVTIERGSFVHRGLLLPRSELSPMSFVARSVVGPLYSQRIAC